MEQWTGSRLGKEYIKAIYHHPAYLIYMQNTSCKILSQMSQKMNQDFQVKYQHLKICRWFHINARMQRGTKKPLDEAERGECKSCLKIQHRKNEDHGIWSYHFKANRWRKMETMTAFIFLGSKITVDGDFSQEIKRRLPPWKKSYDQHRQHVKKQRHYFANKVSWSQSNGFSCSLVWMWKFNHKVAEHQRIDVFEPWCWRRLLRVTWTARRSNHIILKEINPDALWKDWCGSWSSDILATWRYELTHCRNADAGKDWGQEEKGATEDEIIGWHHWLNGHKFKQTPEDNEGQGRLACCNSWCHRVRHDLVTEQRQLDNVVAQM